MTFVISSFVLLFAHQTTTNDDMERLLPLLRYPVHDVALLVGKCLAKLNAPSLLVPRLLLEVNFVNF